MTKRAFSTRLRTLRKQAGMTQQEVAERLNIHRTAYTKYETSGITPDVEGLQVLATLFGVSVDYLLGSDTAAVSAVTENGETIMQLTQEEQQLLNLFRQMGHPEQQTFVRQAQRVARQCNKK